MSKPECRDLGQLVAGAKADHPDAVGADQHVDHLAGGFGPQGPEGARQIGDVVLQVRDDAGLGSVEFLQAFEEAERRPPPAHGARLMASVLVARVAQALEQARCGCLRDVRLNGELGGGIAREFALMFEHHVGKTPLQRRQGVVDVEDLRVE